MSSGDQFKEALPSLQWLIGRWESFEAEVSYPTMETLKYTDNVEFLPLNATTIQYKSETMHPIKKKKLHCESGFLQINQEKNKVALIVAHSFGVTEVSEGDIADDKTLTLESTSFGHTSYAKPSSTVTKIVRNLVLTGEELQESVLMATETQPLQKHLVCRYKKVQ